MVRSKMFRENETASKRTLVNVYEHWAQLKYDENFFIDSVQEANPVTHWKALCQSLRVLEIKEEMLMQVSRDIWNISSHERCNLNHMQK